MINIVSLLEDAGLGLAPVVLMFLSAGVGLLALLFGYRLFRLFMFLAGFAIGSAVLSLFTDVPIAILGGLVVGALCCALWALGIFALGALLGGIVAMAIGMREQMVILLIAVAFGFIAVAIQKFMIIVSTSWFGANLIASVIAGLSERCNVITQLAITVVIAVVGIVCQYTITSGKKKAAVPVANEERQLPKEEAKPEGTAANGESAT